MDFTTLSLSPLPPQTAEDHLKTVKEIFGIFQKENFRLNLSNFLSSLNKVKFVVYETIAEKCTPGNVKTIKLLQLPEM